MPPDEAVIGCTGVLLIGTRGSAGPGEVLVRVRGGSETFLAWSDEPLPQGATVLVIESRGTSRRSTSSSGPIHWTRWPATPATPVEETKRCSVTAFPLPTRRC